jgi:hypothetical protein
MRWAFVFLAAGYLLMMIVLFQAVIVFNGLALLAVVCVGIGTVFAFVGRGGDHGDRH